ncbi:phage/plasmid primase, P4 family [Conyzicola sp.]|uniref:phage/plasmid primase, P4 family n=1 Tax=Conyzicola sp. TaxID=1969404 RepID=UPI00398988D8
MSINTITMPRSTRATSINEFDHELTWEYEGKSFNWQALYLLDRAIAPEVAEARGYYAPETPSEWRLDRSKPFSGTRYRGNADYESAWEGVVGQRPLGIPLFSIGNGPDRAVCIQIRPETPVKTYVDVLDDDGNPETVQSTRRVDDPKNPGGEKLVQKFERAKTEVKKVKFIAPNGSNRGSDYNDLPAPDVHPWAQDFLDNEDPDAKVPALFTEGIHKADAVLSVTARVNRPLVTMAVTGVTMGNHAGGTRENPGREHKLTDGMLDIDWEDREVFIAFDPDWVYKDGVGQAMLISGRLLEAEGATVRIVNVPASEKVNGIDDYLVENDDAALWNLLDDSMDLATAARISKRYPRNDRGRGERLGHEMLLADAGYRFNATTGDALRWLGTHWENDDKDSILYHLAGALALRDPEDENGLSLRGMQAAIKIASSMDGVSVKAEEFDTDGYLLNARNGTIDLMDGSIREHRQSDLITTVTPCDYEPLMATPTWDRFLLQICMGDVELVGYLQRMAGQAIIGKITQPILHVLLGPGNDGKSLLMDMWKAAIGSGYATTIKADAMLGEASDEQVATLRGKRLVTIGEMGQGAFLNDGNLKTMTSSDEVSARQLYEKRVTFVPTWSTFIPTNHAMTVTAQDTGTWRRLRFIPMRLSLSPAQVDTTLPMKLELELPGILAWMVRGAVAFINDGSKLLEVKAVTDETARQRGLTDSIGEWVTDSCVVDPTVKYNRKALYDSYVAAMTGTGLQAVKMPILQKALVERGIIPNGRQVVRDANTRYWPGLRLRTEADVASFRNFEELDTAVPAEREQLELEIREAIEVSRGVAIMVPEPADELELVTVASAFDDIGDLQFD